VREMIFHAQNGGAFVLDSDSAAHGNLRVQKLSFSKKPVALPISNAFGSCLSRSFRKMAKDLDGPSLSEFFAEISRNVSAAFGQHPQMWTSDPSISNMPIEAFFYPEGTGYALLIGINHYGRVSDLHGCVNDANDWKDQLVSCGWKARNI
jgi:hypothetical protein